MEIKNYYGVNSEKIDLNLVNQLIKKSSDWKYIWLSPCQTAESYDGFCGFLETSSTLVEKSINSVLQKNGSYIAEMRLIGENEALYMIADSKESGKTRWSCWIRDNADIKDILPFEGKEGKSCDTFVVTKKVLLRNGTDCSSEKDKVSRGLGTACIKEEKINFDNCYENGNLKCWFLGGSK